MTNKKIPKENPKNQVSKKENPVHGMDFHEIIKRGVRVKPPENGNKY